MIFATILYQVHLSCTAYFPENHFVFKILCIYLYTNIQYINISVVYIYYRNGWFPKKNPVTAMVIVAALFYFISIRSALLGR